MNKEVRKLIKTAEKMGFHWDGKYTGTGHIKLRHPKGFVIISQSPTDTQRFAKNALRDMRRIINGR